MTPTPCPQGHCGISLCDTVYYSVLWKTDTRVYLKFPFSHPTDTDVSGFARAWSERIRIQAFTKDQHQMIIHLPKERMGQGGGKAYDWPHSGFLKGLASEALRKPPGNVCLEKKQW